MEKLNWKQCTYYRDGKPYCLISGEIPYFRVPREEWRRRIRLFKEAGGNAVSTYMPWLLHEPVEGEFRFHGEDYLEIGEFLTICEEENVPVIIRPGPYQYTEMCYEGLPEWLGRQYPEVVARNLDGSTHGVSHVSYTHPVFLEKAHAWYHAMAKEILPHTAEHGGCIVAVQLDNEAMGIHHWFNGQWNEYNPETHGYGKEDGAWPCYLRKKYKSIATLNEAWQTSYTSFSEAMPICYKATDLPTARRNRDYDDYYYQSVATYLETLATWLREENIHLPLLHNSPGTDANAEFYDTVDRLGDNFLLGSDLYYCLGPHWNQNNPTPKYAIWCFTSHEVLRNMGMPASVFEMPSGSCSDYPPILPTDAMAAYCVNAAFGMQGLNYYIFTGGPNPPNSGTTTDVYDFQAPIAANGEIRELYHVQKKFNTLFAELGFAGSHLLHDFTIGYDHAINRAWHWGTALGEDGAFRPADIWVNLRQGVMTTSFLAGYTPSLCDLERHAPDPSKPLWLLTSRVMSRKAQERATEFLAQGGCLIFGPTLPEYDEKFEACHLLADAVGMTRQPHRLEGVAFPQVDMKTVANVSCSGIWYMDPVEGDAVLARERVSGEATAISRNVGAGKVIWLGMNWTHNVHEQSRAFTEFMQQSMTKKPVLTKSNPHLFAVIRETLQGERILFVMNLYSSPQKTDIYLNETAIQDLELQAMEVKILRI